MRALLAAFLIHCFASLALAGPASMPTGAHHDAQAPFQDIQEFVHADFVVDNSPRPPADQADWQPLTLPDVWRQTRPESRAESGWYRIRFDIELLDSALQAIYLPKLIMNASVYLNGVAIGNGGRFEEPIGRNWNRPLLFILPPGLLHAGENTLHIRLRAHPYTQAALHPLSIGPEHLLREQYERAHFLNITVNQTATLLISAIGILMLTLWLRRRQDTAYAYFGAAALVWAAQSTNLYIRDTPVNTAVWEILVNGSFQIFSGLLLISLLRFVSISNPVLMRILWAGILLSPPSLALAPQDSYFTLSSIWHLYTLLCLLGTLALLLRAAFIRGNAEARYLVAAMSLVFVLALHDWLIHSQHIWQGGPFVWPLKDVFLLHYSAPLIFLCIGLIMTGRFVRVLNQFEQLNDQLEERVEAKQSELEASYARLHKLETENAVAEERERIYRDLHDDVGAKLLSLVYRSATSEDADLARSALQDLRDVVSRSGSDSFKLEEVVADWRAECERRLGDAGLQLEWQQSPTLGDLSLSQPQALDLGRILREAVSNTIRHAGASKVRVELSLCADGFCLSFTDDGRGVATEARSGRGIRNMEMRAARQGGQLHRETLQPRGYRILVSIPRAQLQTSTTD